MVFSILFLKAVWNFTSTFSPETASERSRAIMTEFLQTDSSHVVNVDEEIITNITEKILEYGFPFEALFSLAVLLTHFIFYF